MGHCEPLHTSVTCSTDICQDASLQHTFKKRMKFPVEEFWGTRCSLLFLQHRQDTQPRSIRDTKGQNSHRLSCQFFSVGAMAAYNTKKTWAPINSRRFLFNFATTICRIYVKVNLLMATSNNLATALIGRSLKGTYWLKLSKYHTVIVNRAAWPYCYVPYGWWEAGSPTSSPMSFLPFISFFSINP